MKKKNIKCQYLHYKKEKSQFYDPFWDHETETRKCTNPFCQNEMTWDDMVKEASLTPKQLHKKLMKQFMNATNKKTLV